MQHQNYSNHRRYVVMYHFVLFAAILLTLGGSFVNLFKSAGDPQLMYSSSLIVAISVIVLFLFFFCRVFALKAQDRAIRAEENLRHFILTGKPLDPRLSVRQIVGLRFAPDDEFVGLARRAAEESLTEDMIKRAVKNWRGDYYRA